MEAMLYLVVLFFAGALGRRLSPLDEKWQSHNREQKIIDMMESHGHGAHHVKVQSQPPSFAEIDPYIRDNVHFYLYTLQDETPYELINDNEDLLKSSTFDTSKTTKVLIHGYWSDYRQTIEKTLSDAYLTYEDVNIVAVDWSIIAGSYLYNTAAANTMPVGQVVGEMLDFLVSAGGANVSDIHILGHSLGAHVAGFAANYVTSGRITRITGLDPALPLFSSRPPDLKLDASDADVVDCIHTCGKYLAMYDPICTHDFYPNGGKAIQPGCGLDLDGVCSHERSYELYASSIAGHSLYAQACANMKDLHKRSCSRKNTGLLGEPAATTAPGIYLLETTGTYPYVM